MQLGAVRSFPLPSLYARPARSCHTEECGGVHSPDEVQLSITTDAGLAPSPRSLARSGAFSALLASFAGGSSCHACCLDCHHFVHYCTKDAGHSGKHVCPQGHGWY